MPKNKNNIDEVLEEFDKEFIGVLDKFHNRLYFEINERINKTEPEESKIEEIEEETVNRFKTFIKQKLQQIEQRKVEEIREELEKMDWNYDVDLGEFLSKKGILNLKSLTKE